jgi:geranylgeranylglycerol-phosphate geranylgeranyltransferase
MSASMILNDIYDVKIDKINNPNRPLVTGELSRKEAIIVAGILLLTVEVLSFHYLTPNLIWIMQLVMLKIFIYTPVLKKILFVKNISCAGLVSFTIFVSGLAAADSLLETNANVNLFYISTNLIFFGSLYNELLLDIHDMKGDLANNIKTIPVVFGKRVSLFLATLIIGFSVFSNTLSIAYLYRWSVGILLPILCTPIFIDLYKIQKDKFSNESIMKSVKNSSKTLFLLLLYLGAISLV